MYFDLYILCYLKIAQNLTRTYHVYINCFLYIQYQRLARLQNNDDGGIRHVSGDRSDDRSECVLNECMPVAPGRRRCTAASVQRPFLKELAYGMYQRITSLEGLGCKQTTYTRFEQICTIYSSVFKRNFRFHQYVFTKTYYHKIFAKPKETRVHHIIEEPHNIKTKTSARDHDSG